MSRASITCCIAKCRWELYRTMENHFSHIAIWIAVNVLVQYLQRLRHQSKRTFTLCILTVLVFATFAWVNNMYVERPKGKHFLFFPTVLNVNALLLQLTISHRPFLKKKGNKTPKIKHPCGVLYSVIDLLFLWIIIVDRFELNFQKSFILVKFSLNLVIKNTFFVKLVLYISKNQRSQKRGFFLLLTYIFISFFRLKK